MTDWLSNEASHILVCRLPKDTQPGLLRAQNPAKKLIELGMEFTSMEQIIKDAVESLKSKGYIWIQIADDEVVLALL